MWKCPKCARMFEKNNQDHYCTPLTIIDEYIAEQLEGVRPILEKLRTTICAAAPEAIEKISWRMPTFWQGENLIHFAAFNKHIGVYPGDEAVRVFSDKIIEYGYKHTKGAIQLPLNKPITYDFVAEITKYRVKKAKGEI